MSFWHCLYLKLGSQLHQHIIFHGVHQKHNKSHPCQQTTPLSPMPPQWSRTKDNNITMELKCIWSLQVLNINDEFLFKQWLHSWLSCWTLKWCPGWHSSPFPRRMLRYLEGLELPAYFPGSTSSTVMEERFQWLIGSRCEAKADFPRMLSQWKTH